MSKWFQIWNNIQKSYCTIPMYQLDVVFNLSTDAIGIHIRYNKYHAYVCMIMKFSIEYFLQII